MDNEKPRLPDSILEKRITNGQSNFSVRWEDSGALRESLPKEEVKLEPMILRKERAGFSSSNPANQSLHQDENARRKKSEKKRILEFKSYNSSQVSIDEIYGDFESEDKPKSIKKIRKLDEIIEFIMEWQPRENGFQPKDSVVTNKELRKYFPEFLLDFYEKRIVFSDQ